MATKKRNISKIRAEHADNAALIAITDDLENYASLAAIANQEGGKLLISGLVSDVKAAVDTLTVSFKTATHAELIASCASLKASLDLLRVLTRADKNKDLAGEALEEALKE